MKNSIILDMKGVLYNETLKGYEPIKGAIDFTSYLKDNSLNHCYVSNTTTTLPKNFVVKLNQVGFNLDLEDVVSPITISLDYMKKKKLNSIYLISDNQNLFDFYEQNGIMVNGFDIKAVVCGYDRKLNHKTITDSAKYLLKGAELIALNKNMIRVDKEGNTMPNVGTYVVGLENSVNRTAKLMGKPSKICYDTALEKMKVKNYFDVIVVGDDPEVDLSLPHELGMKTVFIPSPKYQKCDLFKPTLVTNNLMEIRRYFNL